jgi:hypothetical protein
MNSDFIIIDLRGQKVKFYPKSNQSGHYYEMFNGNGFYTKDLFPVWGRPNKNNCIDVANSYIESHEGRIKTFDSYKNKN